MWEPVISPLGAEALGCLREPDGLWGHADQHRGWPDGRMSISVRRLTDERRGESVHFTAEVTLDDDADAVIERALVITRLEVESEHAGFLIGFTDSGGIARFSADIPTGEGRVMLCNYHVHHPEYWRFFPWVGCIDVEDE
jgi:hypothetical protein